MSDESKGYLAIIVASVMAIVIGASFAYIGFFTSVSVAGAANSTLSPVHSNGTLTFTGNVTHGEIVNISYGTGMYSFCFNTSVANCGGGNFITVQMTSNVNSSTNATQALSNAINNNATVSGLMTSFNSSAAGVMYLQFDTATTLGNNVGTTTNSSNASWASSTLSGGHEGSTAWTGMQQNTSSGFVLFGIIIMLLGVTGLISVLLGGMGTNLNIGRK